MYSSFTERYHRNTADFESALEEDSKRIEAPTAQNGTIVVKLAAVREELEMAILERDEFEEKVKGLEGRAREAEVRLMDVERINKSPAVETKSAALNRAGGTGDRASPEGVGASAVVRPAHRLS